MLAPTVAARALGAQNSHAGGMLFVQSKCPQCQTARRECHLTKGHPTRALCLRRSQSDTPAHAFRDKGTTRLGRLQRCLACNRSPFFPRSKPPPAMPLLNSYVRCGHKNYSARQGNGTRVPQMSSTLARQLEIYALSTSRKANVTKRPFFFASSLMSSDHYFVSTVQV